MYGIGLWHCLSMARHLVVKSGGAVGASGNAIVWAGGKTFLISEEDPRIESNILSSLTTLFPVVLPPSQLQCDSEPRVLRIMIGYSS